MRKPTSVDPLEVKGLWEIGHILSLPHSIFIQKIFFLHIRGISY